MSQVIVGLVPDDVDPAAAEWAMALAAATAAELTAVGAWKPKDAELPPERYEELSRAARANLARALTAAADRVKGEVTCNVRLLSEHPTEALLHAIDELDARLVVLGHPDDVAARLTSHAEHVANHAPCPVVIARAAGPDPHLGGPVIAAVDGAAGDTSVIAWAQDLARATGAEAIAAYAEPAGDRSYPHPADATRAAEVLEEVEAEVAAGDGGLRIVVVHGEPDTAIGELARRTRAELVVMSRGRGLLLDKVPARLIKAGDVNVVVVPDEPFGTHHDRPAPARLTHLEGLLHKALGWATADRRTEARGELELLAADQPGGAGADVPAERAEEVLDEAELRVRSDHGDLAPGVDPPGAGSRTERRTEGG